MAVSQAKTVIAVVIVILYLALTYADWWMAIVGSVLIVVLSKLAWSNRGTQVVGLEMSARQIGVSLLLLVVVLMASLWIVQAIAAREGAHFVPVYEDEKRSTRLIHTLGQTLNEEMVLGALLLRFIQGRLKSTRPFAISAGVAAVFSLVHYLFYGLRPPQAPNYGTLSVATLVSLFLVGVVRNNCILGTGHIGYAWAIHMGWNIAFIDGSFYWPETGAKLVEPSMFNMILGDRALVIATSILMVLSLLPYARKKESGNRRI